MLQHRFPLAFLLVSFSLLFSVSVSLAQGPAPRGNRAPATPAGEVGTAFTYQGQLKKGGSPYTGTCDFQFSLWDAASGGVQAGSAVNAVGVNVANGLFTVAVDFGPQFMGAARWLETGVKCTGDGGFTPLASRTVLTAAPYALSLVPGAVISTTGTLGLRLNVPNGNALTAYGQAAGYAAIYGSDTSAGSLGGYGVYGMSANGAGVYGKSSVTFGGSPVGGVVGVSDAGPGVIGQTQYGWAVYGLSQGSGAGVYGYSATGDAGRFSGKVSVLGDLGVQGTLTKGGGSFKIDHPLDPANEYLSHSFVESPDMMNVYNGNVTTDANGEATVTLPAYFQALNKDYRYQLTVIGTFAQAIVSQEIADNRFGIKTDKPNVKVSWQVTGIRQDPYANAHRIQVEEPKAAGDKGKYLYPSVYGQPEQKGIGYEQRPAANSR